MNRDVLKGAIGFYLAQQFGIDAQRGLTAAEGVLYIIENLPRQANDGQPAQQAGGNPTQVSSAAPAGTAGGTA